MNAKAGPFDVLTSAAPARLQGRRGADRSEVVRSALRAIASQEAIAEELGIRQQAVSNWIRRGFIPDRALRMMSLIYDIDVDLLRRPIEMDRRN